MDARAAAEVLIVPHRADLRRRGATVRPAAQLSQRALVPPSLSWPKDAVVNELRAHTREPRSDPAADGERAAFLCRAKISADLLLSRRIFRAQRVPYYRRRDDKSPFGHAMSCLI
ncbi:hypothetical protein MRX96_058274 [Rhipicephalus microplus]